MSNKKILFISWDGPQTSYMEGLFMPIFNLVAKQTNIDFHIIQFTWHNSKKTAHLKKTAALQGIKYIPIEVMRKPGALLGSLFTVIKGSIFLKNYIKNNKIDIVMPRSTMPAVMINRIKHKNFKICFDADGLPIEERVDFAGLTKKSLTYKILKKEEKIMLEKADAVVTRSNKAINYHLNNIGYHFKNKFSVVFNGRNTTIFKPNSEQKQQARQELGLNNNNKLFVYCGSLGPQYGWREMMAIFKAYYKINTNARFLILTGDLTFAETNMEADLKSLITIKSVAFEKVPYYLNAANIAFAIREPKPSMIGVAPIKLGEYLLMGLPTIASAGIGDTEEILNKIPNCFVYSNAPNNGVQNAVAFIQSVATDTEVRQIIRNEAKQYFSLEKSAESYIRAINQIQ